MKRYREMLRREAESIGIHDSTVYGSSRASTQSFFYHHLASISAAIVQADALTLNNHAAAESFQLTLAAPAPRTPAGQAYLEGLGLQATDAWSLFRIIDVDQSLKEDRSQWFTSYNCLRFARPAEVIF